MENTNDPNVLYTLTEGEQRTVQLFVAQVTRNKVVVHDLNGQLEDALKLRDLAQQQLQGAMDFLSHSHGVVGKLSPDLSKIIKA